MKLRKLFPSRQKFVGNPFRSRIGLDCDLFPTRGSRLVIPEQKLEPVPDKEPKQGNLLIE